MTIAELIAAAFSRSKPSTTVAPTPEFNPENPWDAPALRAVAVKPTATLPSAPQTFAVPDPFAEAQKLEQRQEDISRLTTPTTPLLEVPLDIIYDLFRATKSKKEKK